MNHITGIFLKVIIIVLILEVVLMKISVPVKAFGIVDDILKWGDNFEIDGRNQAIKDNTATDEKISDVITILYNIL